MKKLLPILFFSASTARAQVVGSTTISGMFSTFVGILNSLVPVLAGLATIFFIYGVVRYIASAGNPEKRQTAKDFIIWGLVGLFVLIGFWGFVNILLNSVFGGTPSVSTWPPRFF